MKKILIPSLLICLLLTACAAEGANTPREQQTQPPSATVTAPTMDPRTGEATAATVALQTTPAKEPESVSRTEENIPEETEAVTTEEAVTQTTAELAENTAFTELAGPCDEAILGAVYNTPFPDGDPIPTVIWNEGEYDQLVIYPRYVGSKVFANRITYDYEREMRYVGDPPVYETVCKEGDAIGAALDRPEGGTEVWMVTVQAPDGRAASLELNYNGRYGTPAYEYLTEQRLEPEELEKHGGFLQVMGLPALESALRAEARLGREPGDLLADCCDMASDYGDSAAYTLWQGEMEGDTYRLQAARFREGYSDWDDSLEERTRAQWELYLQIGNELGILREEEKDPDFLLKGLTVYNPTLRARRVQVTVNGTDAGLFNLTEGDFVTLLPLELPAFPADRPLDIQIQVVETCWSDPSLCLLEVWPCLRGNISGAR